jgi:hypothetical protein
MHVNGDYLYKKKGVLIFIAGDGLHSEIIVPVKNETNNWETTFQASDFNNDNEGKEWLSIGFSEKTFYKTNRRWDDMNYPMAFAKLCGFGQSIIHVNYEKEYPFDKKFIRKIYWTRAIFANFAILLKAVLNKAMVSF